MDSSVCDHGIRIRPGVAHLSGGEAEAKVEIQGSLNVGGGQRKLEEAS
jgi:hypothetical protein